MDAQTFGWIATVLFTLCYVPQIFRMMYSRSVKGVSIFFLMIPIVANCIALQYATMIHQNPLVVKYILGLIFSSSCFIAYLAVRRAEERREWREFLSLAITFRDKPDDYDDSD